MRKEAKIYVTVIVLLTFICSCFLLTGCSAEASTSNDNFTTLYSSPTKNVYDYMDPDTGVHYLIYDGYNAGGMTIRYNADGTIMVTEHPEDK